MKNNKMETSDYKKVIGHIEDLKKDFRLIREHNSKIGKIMRNRSDYELFSQSISSLDFMIDILKNDINMRFIKEEHKRIQNDGKK